ncbi:hypothetical protein ZEAMMB73_Zm00001d000345 [Zea mays]|nr:hypothetical protein ZEAMMB73_Zm00001d000345 [Zea mays]
MVATMTASNAASITGTATHGATGSDGSMVVRSRGSQQIGLQSQLLNEHSADIRDPAAGAFSGVLVETTPPPPAQAHEAFAFLSGGTAEGREPNEQASHQRRLLGPEWMGFMLRVRLASFFVGAAAAAAGGGYFLYKDYKLANDSLALKLKLPVFVKFLSALHDSSCVQGQAPDLNNVYPQVKCLQDSTDTRYEALEKRLAALEGLQSPEAAPDVDTPSD